MKHIQSPEECGGTVFNQSSNKSSIFVIITVESRSIKPVPNFEIEKHNRFALTILFSPILLYTSGEVAAPSALVKFADWVATWLAIPNAAFPGVPN